MQCERCGAEVPTEASACPDCGEAIEAPEPAPKKKPKNRGLLVATLALAFVLLGSAATVVYLALPEHSRSGLSGVGAGSGASASVEPTLTPEDLDQISAENAVKAFYEALNTHYIPVIQSLVTSDTRSAINAKLLKGWVVNSFQPVRTVIEGDGASVYGHESVRAFGARTLGVKFRLARVNEKWLIQFWLPADEGAIKGAVPGSGMAAGPIGLTEATARDVVSTLLQAHQVGDSATIRLVTTPRFQQVHAATWLNDVNNSATFTQFAIASVKKKGSVYVLTSSETWSARPRNVTYTVIMVDHTILVDATSAK